jgi:cysteine desulfurase
MTEARIFLDYASTSPVDLRVAEAMHACLTIDGSFGNPASPHGAGQDARRVIEVARSEIGKLINADGSRLVFTSGATEANNLALSGFLGQLESEAGLITTAIEHRSVLDAARFLEAGGVRLTVVPADANGIVSPAAIREAIQPYTRLVSVMHVNNEIGTVQPIGEIAAVCRDAGVALHVDAAQAAGKVPLDVEGWRIDLCSLTAHKVNGPKGIGALYVREGLTLAPMIHGGDASLGIRAGTIPTHQVAGFGKAFQIARERPDIEHLAGLRDLLWHGLAGIGGATRHGDAVRVAPHILSVSFAGAEGESLRQALSDIAVSAGSACTSNDPAPSHVLRSLGLSDVRAESTLRFGVGRFTTSNEVERVIERVATEVARLRALGKGAPDWCSS